MIPNQPSQDVGICSVQVLVKTCYAKSAFASAQQEHFIHSKRLPAPAAPMQHGEQDRITEIGNVEKHKRESFAPSTGATLLFQAWLPFVTNAVGPTL